MSIPPRLPVSVCPPHGPAILSVFSLFARRVCVSTPPLSLLIVSAEFSPVLQLPPPPQIFPPRGVLAATTPSSPGSPAVSLSASVFLPVIFPTSPVASMSSSPSQEVVPVIIVPAISCCPVASAIASIPFSPAESSFSYHVPPRAHTGLVRS